MREEGEEEEGKDFDDLRGKGNKREGVAAYLSMVRKVGEGAPTSFDGARAWRRRAGPVVVSRGASGGVWRSSKGGPAAAAGGGATAGRRREGRGRAERAECRSSKRTGGGGGRMRSSRVLEGGDAIVGLGLTVGLGSSLYLALFFAFFTLFISYFFSFPPCGIWVRRRLARLGVRLGVASPCRRGRSPCLALTL